MKLQLSKQLVDNTKTYRLDIVSTKGKYEVDDLLRETKNLVQILNDFIQQLEVKQQELKRSNIKE